MNYPLPSLRWFTLFLNHVPSGSVFLSRVPASFFFVSPRHNPPRTTASLGGVRSSNQKLDTKDTRQFEGFQPKNRHTHVSRGFSSYPEAAHGGDRSRSAVVGQSAGAQLAATCLWPRFGSARSELRLGFLEGNHGSVVFPGNHPQCLLAGSPSSARLPFFLGEGSPTKIDYRKKKEQKVPLF